MSDVREHSTNPGAYTGLKVVEIASTPGAEYASRLLGEMGAAVIKIEPPSGADSRRVGPFAGGVEDGEHSLNFWFYNGDKRSLTLDVATDAGRVRLDALLGDADLLVTDLQPAALARLSLSLETLSAKHPKLIIGAVTPYGLTGPWKDYQASDLVALAVGGPLHMCGYDDHSIPPIRPGGNQGYHTATAFAHIGLLLALIERQHTGRGQIVDTSMHASLALTVELANPYWFYPRSLVFRQTCRHAQPVATQPTLFECADGYVYFALVITEEKPWQALIEWLGHHDFLSGLEDPAYLDAGYRQKHFHDIQQVVEAFFLINSAHDMYREGQSRGLPIGKLNAPEDLFDDEHEQARGFFVPVEHPGTGPVSYAAPAYWFSAFSPVAPKAAPRVGDANAEYGVRS
jgi:crotonobetainyl-CoA:carnitine CoA-transferase CaiB-like acyl-CoA transferase